MVHKTGNYKKKNFQIGNQNNDHDQDVLMDNEGVDVSEWMLEQKKRVVEVVDESAMIEKYNKNFDVMKLFQHFVSEKYLTLKEEQKIVKDYYVNKSKGIQDYASSMESIKFEIFNKKTEYTY